MLYFSSQKIPELQGLNFAQRMQVVRAAADKLPTPTKVGLNTLKLIIIFGLFILVARADGWAILGYALLVAPVYMLITRPITFALCQSQFSAMRQQLFEQNARQTQDD
ncbi:hypothetical protein SAMN06297280_0848 [Arsukibacterium tuosuense]|uniref:Uncharacterized protein n=1 Tax=Arsukibacterium tuosuense TaxID=1323745 RepID=A0A285IE11_9GAMM|nr:DUF6170 family protein [Arsukibacterium tuosuense]SNY45191.1 hypothetical protein SAMN06297280_0848 [Arsukibacterium tuosuense]